MVATDLSIDPILLARALELSGGRTEKAAVDQALREFVAHREQMKLRELFGKLEWDADFDYKRERTRTSGRSSSGAMLPRTTRALDRTGVVPLLCRNPLTGCLRLE